MELVLTVLFLVVFKLRSYVFIVTKNKPTPIDKSDIVAILHPSDNTHVTSYSTSNLVLDTEFPAMEPALQERDNAILS